MSHHGDPLGGSQRLGKYDVQGEIGRGGMGVVYRGYDSLLDRPVAIKVLAPHLVWEPGFVDRFLREARTAARLKHTGIVAIYDVGQEGSNYYIVMEYLEGRTLSSLIRQKGPMPYRQVLSILQPLAEALDFAHRQGLVHRDVKPANVVVDSAGHVTLTDFGVARAAQETRLTTTGALVGTPQYMSPEQAQGNDVDHRTDIYSLAVVAYQMLAGRMPFDAATPHAVLHQVIYDPPPALHPQRPDLPAELEGILAKALAKDPAGRYNSASAFVEALEGLGARGARQAVPSAPGRPPAKAAPAAAGRVLQPRAPVRATAGAQPAVGPRFGLAWFLASTLAWAIGWALGIPLADATGRLIGPTGSITLVEVTSGLAYWLVLGLAVGTAQWLLLRRHMSGMWEWIVATAAGLGVVGSLKWTQAILIDPIMNNVFRWLEGMGWERVGFVAGMLMAMITEGLGGLLVGLAQWVTLQNRVPRHGRWLLVSTGAWAASGLVVSLLMMSLQLPDGDPATMWVPPLLAGVVVSAVTAAGAVRLLAGTAKEQHATI